MKTGDRVKHKKHGLGTVKACGFGSYEKQYAARILFDSGHDTVCSISRLTAAIEPMPSVNPDNMPVLETEPKRKRSSSAHVDYALIDRAKEAAREKYPQAVQIVGRWYGGRAYCEIWDGQAATIEFYSGA